MYKGMWRENTKRNGMYVYVCVEYHLIVIHMMYILVFLLYMQCMHVDILYIYNIF